jgi:hypothetical protein
MTPSLLRAPTLPRPPSWKRELPKKTHTHNTPFFFGGGGERKKEKKKIVPKRSGPVFSAVKAPVSPLVSGCPFFWGEKKKKKKEKKIVPSRSGPIFSTVDVVVVLVVHGRQHAFPFSL